MLAEFPLFLPSSPSLPPPPSPPEYLLAPRPPVLQCGDRVLNISPLSWVLTEGRSLQLDSERITHEQATQAIEERFAKLSETYAASVEEKRQLEGQMATAQAEVASLKARAGKQELDLTEKLAEVSRLELQMRELRADKQSLLQIVDQRSVDVAQREKAIEGHLERVAALVSERTETTAKLREAETAMGSVKAQEARLKQEKEILEKHNNWLTEELESKSKMALEDGKRATATALELKQRLHELVLQAKSSEEKASKAEERNRTLENDLEAAQLQLKGLKEEFATQQANFDQELVTAKKLSALYKDGAEGHANRVKELEGILKELNEHNKRSAETHKEALLKAEEARDAALKEVGVRKDQLQAAMDAASQGISPLRPMQLAHLTTPASRGATVTPDGGGDLAGTPGGAAARLLHLSPAAATAAMMKEGMSLTEIYSKYAEAADAWRQERMERKRLQAQVDKIFEELEQKAPAINAQREEYERLLESHARLTAQLEQAAQEHQKVEFQLQSTQGESRRHKKEAEKSSLLVKDLSRQVQTILKELSDLRGNRARLGPIGQVDITPSDLPAEVTTAGDIISERLVEFTDLEGLQRQNVNLLTVARQLAQDSEEAQSGIRSEAEERLSRIKSEYEMRLTEISSQRAQNASILQKTVRERDFYRQYLRDMSSSEAKNGDRGNLPPLPAGLTDSVQDAEAKVAEYRGRCRDLEGELTRVREEAVSSVNLLREDCESVRAQASEALAARARAEAALEFERGRVSRLEEQQKALRSDLESTGQLAATTHATATRAEQMLGAVKQELESARSALRTSEAKSTRVEAELSVLRRHEEGARAEVETVSRERHRLSASLEAAEKQHRAREAEHAREGGNLRQELSKAREEWATVQKELAEERARSRDQATAGAGAGAEAAANVARLSAEIAAAQAEVANEKQRAATALARVETLQASLLRAERKAAQSSTPVKAGASEVPSSSDPGADHLKSELAAAQEAAAAAAAHAQQYRAISEAAEGTNEKLREGLEHLKKEHVSAMEEAAKKVESAKTKEAAAERELRELRDKQGDIDAERISREEKTLAELNMSKQRCREAEQAQEELEERVEVLGNDVKSVHEQWRSAQNLYERELLAHAEAVKKLNVADAAMEKVEDALRDEKAARSAEVENLKSKIAGAEAAKAGSEAKVGEFEARCKELVRQTELLHQQLQKTPAAGQTEGTAEGEVVEFLRRERDTAACEAELLRQEKTRWQRQAETAQKSAEEARALLQAEVSIKKANLASEGEHKALLAKVEQLNLLRESNATLRQEAERLAGVTKGLRQALEDKEKAGEGTGRRLRELEALVKASAQERDTLKAASDRWEKRCNQLLEKHGKVDLAEHQNALALREAAEKAKAKLDAENKKLLAQVSQGAAALEHSQRQERIAKAREKLFNPEGLSQTAWRELEAKKKKDAEEIAALQKKTREMLEGKAKSLEAAVEREKKEKEKLKATAAEGAQEAAAASSQRVAKLQQDLTNAKTKGKEMLELYKKQTSLLKKTRDELKKCKELGAGGRSGPGAKTKLQGKVKTPPGPASEEAVGPKKGAPGIAGASTAAAGAEEPRQVLAEPAAVAAVPPQKPSLLASAAAEAVAKAIGSKAADPPQDASKSDGQHKSVTGAGKEIEAPVAASEPDPKLQEPLGAAGEDTPSRKRVRDEPQPGAGEQEPGAGPEDPAVSALQPVSSPPKAVKKAKVEEAAPPQASAAPFSPVERDQAVTEAEVPLPDAPPQEPGGAAAQAPADAGAPQKEGPIAEAETEMAVEKAPAAEPAIVEVDPKAAADGNKEEGEVEEGELEEEADPEADKGGIQAGGKKRAIQWTPKRGGRGGGRGGARGGRGRGQKRKM